MFVTQTKYLKAKFIVEISNLKIQKSLQFNSNVKSWSFSKHYPNPIEITEFLFEILQWYATNHKILITKVHKILLGRALF